MIRRDRALFGLALAAFCSAAALARAQSPSDAQLSADHNDLSSASPARLAAPVEHIDIEPRRADAPAAQPISGTANPLWAIPIDSLHATRERPLFSASRRPPPPPMTAPAQVEVSAPPPPPEPEKPQITLVGVVHGGEAELGLFSDSSGKPITLHVGQDDHGWVVRSVDLRATTLEKDNQQVKLELPARNAETAGSPFAPPVGVMASTSPAPPPPGGRFSPHPFSNPPPCPPHGPCPQP
ncbi:hypothetical protein [Methylocella tundrae]|uniref:hypothetical protein n=1 Tax=Methylocella tundrae TaxID=227605 RepID=UPI0030FF09AE|nr:hypothetical protein SIN04_07895 [Methylocella tundrae]